MWDWRSLWHMVWPRVSCCMMWDGQSLWHMGWQFQIARREMDIVTHGVTLCFVLHDVRWTVIVTRDVTPFQIARCEIDSHCNTWCDPVFHVAWCELCFMLHDVRWTVIVTRDVTPCFMLHDVRWTVIVTHGLTVSDYMMWDGQSLNTWCDPVFQVARCEMDSHLRDSMTAHMLMLCQGVTQIFQVLRLRPLSQEGVQRPTRELSPTEMSGALSGMVSTIQQFGQLSIDSGTLRPSFDTQCLPQVS